MYVRFIMHFYCLLFARVLLWADTGLYYEAGLKEGFSECIAALPEGNLKQELVDNMEQYCVDLLS